MRKIVVSEFVTLDGVADEPDWTGPYWLDEIFKFKYDELFESDALLLGRVTYDIFARTWPIEPHEQGYANRINGLPKFVVTTTLEKADWNNTTLIKENILEEIARLKEQPGQNIIILGSSTLVDTLMQADLIDEYRLMVFPVVKGTGLRLFKDGRQKALKLAGTKTFSTGVVVFTYQPADKEEGK